MRKRAFTLIELLVVMAIIALLIGLLLPALAKARAQAKLLKDGTQIKQVHTAWVAFSNEYEGILPTPGLINREEVDPNDGGGSREIPGRGEEHIIHNHTAAIHSAAIMQNYYTPELCVGPTEPNANVYVLDDYNWEMYNVEEDRYWDPRFTAKLQAKCNTSYSSMPLTGRRKQLEWRDTANSTYALLGNRGPENGECEQESHITYEIHGGRKQWAGNIAFGDNHVKVFHTCLPQGIDFSEGGESQADNLFNADSDLGVKGADIYNCMVERMRDDGEGGDPSIGWD